MLSKYDYCKCFLENDDILICPICKERLSAFNHSLLCKNNHNFNISKKGTVNLLNSSYYKDSKIYNHTLFYNRRKFIETLFYKDLYKAILEIINNYFNKGKQINILDLGCGEGTHTINILKEINSNYKYYGFDYSKSGIDMASDYNYNNRFYFISDVNNVPVKNKSIDLIIDILSPYNVNEIKRVIKDDGIFIKVSPGKNYLKELRKALGMDTYEKEKEIEDNFKKNFSNYKKHHINVSLSINEKDFVYLLNMTPIYGNKLTDIPNKITIDLMLYVVK